MQLTSIRRLRVFVLGKQTEPLTDRVDYNRLLAMWLDSVSGLIEKYLDRTIQVQTRTQYFDLNPTRIRFFLDTFPATSLTSVYYDSSGLWEGYESEITDSFLGVNNDNVNIPYALDFTGAKAVRAIYTGGIALHAVNTVATVTDATAFTVGNYVIGDTSGAVGIVNAKSGTSLTIENYYGTFLSSEGITEYTDEGVTLSGVVDTITAFVSESLCQIAPEIVQAAEAQIRYYWTHTTDFENSGSQKDGTTIRRQSLTVQRWPLQEEVRELINGYRRIVF